QFRLERRYRRRAKLKWARPTWTKFVKLSTWATISFVVVYGLLFMDIEEGTVFGTIREYYERTTNDMFGTARRPPPIKPRATTEQDQSAS
ncbi:hypothetical protein KCU98_g18370, partial [Aureobasidium melanogenum]